MVQIRVTHSGGDDFDVRVQDPAGTSRHRVTVSPAELSKYAPDADRAALVEESFRFLLEREPKESILSRFSLSTIERYFPEYAEQIRHRVS